MSTAGALRRLAAAALALAPAARADFVASGRFLYVDKEFSFDSGYTGVEPNLPVRFADVKVIDASSGNVLAQGFTDASGNFSIFVPGSGTSSVEVRCYATSFGVGGTPVRVQTTAGIVYSTASPVFPNWNLSSNLDVGTVVAQKIVTSGQQGNPFNLLDMGLRALEYVQQPSIGAGPPSSTVTLRWPGGSSSYASGATVTMAVDDAYDDMTALHELGHVVHYLYSDSDSPGGSHGFGQSNQDPRLSFGEGWASFFGGLVRNSSGDPDPGYYLDANNNGATGPGTIQLRMRFENGFPYGATTGGEADEGSIFCSLWDAMDDVATPDPFPGDDDPFDGSLPIGGGLTPEGAQWSVFVGPVAAAPNLTLADWWNGWFAPVNFGNPAELAAVFAAWKSRFSNDAAEENGTIATAAPLTAGPTFWTPTRTLYFSSASPPAPGFGDLDHYRLFVPAGATIEAETRYPGGLADAETFCDPALVLYSASGATLASAESGGYDRNARIAGVAAATDGFYAVRVNTNSAMRPYGSYEVRVLLAPGGGAPVLTGSTPALSQSSGGSLTLSLASDPSHAGRPYLVFASASGAHPGTTLPGGLLLPLNVDAVTEVFLAATNSPAFANTFGVLHAGGGALASVVLPAGADPLLVGVEFTFAAAVFAPNFASVLRTSSSVTVAIVE